MNYTSTLDAEFEALMGVTDGAYRLYMELRRFMHRSDGLAYGKGVTWRELGSQSMWIRPRQGVQKSGSREKHLLLQYKDELIKAGLIEELGDKQTYLKFRFPVFLQHYQSVAHFCDQNKQLPNSYPQELPNSYPKRTEELGTYDGQGGNQLPPKSGKHLPSPISHTSSSSSGDVFALHSDWEPSEFFKKLARQAMIDIEDEHKAAYQLARVEMIMFWSSPDTLAKYATHKTYRTQQAWEKVLLGKLTEAKNGVSYLQAVPTAKRASAKTLGLPKADDELAAWAQQHGFPAPPRGKSMYEYRQLLQAALTQRQQQPHSLESTPLRTPDSKPAPAVAAAQSKAERDHLIALAKRAGVDPRTLGVKDF